MAKKSKVIYIVGSIIIGISVMLIAFLALVVGGVIDTRSKLVFESGSAEKVYDGTPLVCNEWEIISGRLESGHTAVVTVNASRTDAGISPNYFTVTILDGSGADKTDSYNVIYQPGELTVRGVSLSIRTDSATKDYDGTKLTSEGYAVLSGELLDGHTISITVMGERIDAGISDNEFLVVIRNAAGADVTHNYDIERLNGKLEIKRLNISIKTPSYHGVYDGNPVTLPDWSFASGTQVLDGHQISVVVSGSQTDAGVSVNFISEIKITDNGRNVTDNYAVTRLEGDLIVTPRTLTLRSESAIKEYDGRPLTNGNWEYVSQSRPVTGHTVTVVISGIQLLPGESKNVVAEVIIKAGNRDVTFNYEIKLQEGLLIVTGDYGGGGSGTGSGSGSSSGGGAANLDESGKIGGSGMTDGGEDGDGGDGGGGGEDTVAVRVYSDVSGKIYLRYMSFGNYTGNKWLSASDYTELIESKYSLNYLTSIALKNAGYTSNQVSIEVFSSNYLLPYYLDLDELSYKIQTSDVKYTGNTGAVYSAYYYLFSFIDAGLSPSDLGIYAELEREYYEYVKTFYLYVPSVTNTFLQQIIRTNNFNKDNADIISAVANYIQKAAKYNLNYNANLDKESDIVVSFLRDYKEGICQHYATAATMLYRALGIPARYVIGYVGETKKGEWTEITGKNAHAWVEVYLKGIGWIQVEVTGGGPGLGGGNSGGNGGSNGGNNGGGSGGGSYSGTLRIKPVDLFKQYTNGAVLSAGNEVQGLAALLEKGYTYTVTITGKQTTIGIGESVITAFVLRDPSGKDVTDEYKITFEKGKLHLYMRELTVTTETLRKIYDGTPLVSEDGFSVEGELISGHYYAKCELSGSQRAVGQSENSVYILLKDERGNDVTFMYKINRNYGTLTVGAREITVTAGSASKVYDGSELTCVTYTVTSESGDALGEGHVITVKIEGSQTQAGRSNNVVTSVEIEDEDGNDVTSNYSIKYVSGLLTVTR